MCAHFREECRETGVAADARVALCSWDLTALFTFSHNLLFPGELNGCSGHRENKTITYECLSESQAVRPFFCFV